MLPQLRALFRHPRPQSLLVISRNTNSYMISPKLLVTMAQAIPTPTFPHAGQGTEGCAALSPKKTRCFCRIVGISKYAIVRLCDCAIVVFSVLGISAGSSAPWQTIFRAQRVSTSPLRRLSRFFAPSPCLGRVLSYSRRSLYRTGQRGPSAPGPFFGGWTPWFWGWG
jgi:hypothetical protein